MRPSERMVSILSRLLAYPMLTEKLLRDLIDETRRRGWSLNRGLFHHGAWAIGRAIRNGSGVVIGALSIGAIESRLNETRQPEVSAMLEAEAKKLEARIAAFDDRPRGTPDSVVNSIDSNRKRNGSEARL